MAKYHVKRNDEVKVIAGAHKGKTGKIIRLDQDRALVWVQNVNKRIKNLRRTQENPKGGQVNREMPIHISNVALVTKGATE